MLDKETQLKAEQELNETEETKKEELLDLHEWIKNQNKIPQFTDPKWLLPFLRVSKFTQNEARSRLSKYWKSRRKGIMHAMNGVDPASSCVLDILRGPHFVYLPLPGCDVEGRQLILARWQTLDTSGQTYTFKQWFRAINLLFDTLCFLDEKVMVNGVTFLMDASGLALRHLTFFGFHNSIQQFEVMQGGYPIRIKQVHYFNNNSIVSLLFSVVKKVISTKLANRIHFHGYNMDALYENMDMSILPDEYLPADYTGPRAGTCSQIMENFIQEKILDRNNLQFFRRLYSCDIGKVENGDCPNEEPDHVALGELRLDDHCESKLHHRDMLVDVPPISEQFYDCN